MPFESEALKRMSFMGSMHTNFEKRFLKLINWRNRLPIVIQAIDVWFMTETRADKTKVATLTGNNLRPHSNESLFIKGAF